MLWFFFQALSRGEWGQESREEITTLMRGKSCLKIRQMTNTSADKFSYFPSGHCGLCGSPRIHSDDSSFEHHFHPVAEEEGILEK